MTTDLGKEVKFANGSGRYEAAIYCLQRSIAADNFYRYGNHRADVTIHRVVVQPRNMRRNQHV
jgi:hypothetical protein